MARLYLYGAKMCVPGYEHCPIKIGITSEPQNRFRGLKSSLPFPLEWFGAWPAKKGREDEQRVFEMFAQQRLGGEWFYPSEALLEFIKDNVQSYETLVAAHKNKCLTPKGRSPKDVNHWMWCADICTYDEFEAAFQRTTRLVGELCAKCGAESPGKEAERLREQWRETSRAAITSDLRPWLTEKDAMQMLSINEDQFTFLIDNQAITHARLGKLVRFRREYLLDFLDTRWARATIPMQ